jgi:pimeloyl-ACP methyl ester carboxylesterase
MSPAVAFETDRSTAGERELFAQSTPVASPQMPVVEGVEHHYALIDGVRIHYATAGEGPPLVLLHGWPQHWWSWRRLIGPLAASHRVICPDIRGMGWSDTPRRGYSRSRLVMDLLGLMDALSMEQVSLIGHDWGLLVGYETCFTQPQRIRRFVAMGGIHPWTARGLPPTLAARVWQIYALASPLGAPATLRLGLPERCLQAWRYRGTFTPGELETYLGGLRSTIRAIATHQRYRALVLADIPHYALSFRGLRLRVPTLHLNGEYDPLTKGTPDSYRRFADEMRLEIIPDCGHFLAEERPDVVAARILEFLP